MKILLPNALRARLRNIDWLHEMVRSRRAQRQEQEYVAHRDRYAELAGPVFAEPGWKVRSRQALAQRWSGPHTVKKRIGDVRLFVAAADDMGAPRMLQAIARSCDAEIFDLGVYRDFSSQAQAERMALTMDSWRPRMQQDLIAAFRRAHAREPIDLIFAYGNHFEFDAETFRALGESGVPVVDLCLDDKHIFHPRQYPWPNGQQPLIGSVDVHLTNSPDSIRWYMAEGAPAYFMPQGVDPEIFRKLDVQKTHDVVFIGQRYGMRARLVDALRSAGINVQCYGRGWGTGAISDQEMIEQYNRARINLGIGGTGVSERMTCIKGRDFEVPATGSLYLTSYNPELTSLFEVGREIVCYSNEIDCVELVRYYLERPEEAERIGEAGRQRVLRDHTWETRFRDLVQWMGIIETR